MAETPPTPNPGQPAPTSPPAAKAPTLEETLADATVALHAKELKDIEGRLASTRYRWWAWPIAAVIGFITGAYGATLKNPFPAANEEHDLFAGAVAILAAIAVPAAYGAFIFVTRWLLANSKHRAEFQLTRAQAERLKASIEDDFFTKLVKINFRYIDQYYYQTQEQANKSFRLSVAAASTGFGMVLVGIAMMFFKLVEPAYVTTAVGTISQFVAAVFFYLYNKTILKMGEYHEKLVLTQNISVALKIAEGLPEAARVQAQQTLIERLTQDVNLYLSDHNRPPAKE